MDRDAVYGVRNTAIWSLRSFNSEVFAILKVKKLTNRVIPAACQKVTILAPNGRINQFQIHRSVIIRSQNNPNNHTKNPAASSMNPMIAPIELEVDVFNLVPLLGLHKPHV